MPPVPDNSFINRADLLKMIRAEFVAYGAAHGQDYNALRKRIGDAIDGPGKRIAQRQHDGLPAACAYQIWLELGWLAKYCTDWDVAERRLADLARAMNDLDSDTIDPLQAADGSWGGCIGEWYRRLEPTVDALQVLADGVAVQPLAFMVPLANARQTLDRLWRLQISDIRATGRNNRDELGALQTALSQLIFKDSLRDVLDERPELGFTVSDELATYYGDFLRQTQHPRTGYWGPWYRIGGELLQVQDLSFTFHTINYRSGNVDNWPLIVDTTLAIETLVYPAGWKPNGAARYTHHNNYDVVTIFAFGWPHMSAGQKGLVRAKIRELLQWCLTESMGPDGFRDEADTALPDTYYYGVRFLDRLGFWDPARRFWSHRAPELPPSAGTPGDLAARLRTTFEALHDQSSESQTVRAVLKAAVCLSAIDIVDTV